MGYFFFCTGKFCPGFNDRNKKDPDAVLPHPRSLTCVHPRFARPGWLRGVLSAHKPSFLETYVTNFLHWIFFSNWSFNFTKKRGRGCLFKLSQSLQPFAALKRREEIQEKGSKSNQERQRRSCPTEWENRNSCIFSEA